MIGIDDPKYNDFADRYFVIAIAVNIERLIKPIIILIIIAIAIR